MAFLLAAATLGIIQRSYFRPILHTIKAKGIGTDAFEIGGARPVFMLLPLKFSGVTSSADGYRTPTSGMVFWVPWEIQSLASLSSCLPQRLGQDLLNHNVMQPALAGGPKHWDFNDPSQRGHLSDWKILFRDNIVQFL